MAINWYPVIDILTCIECGTCVNFCPHGVYDKQKSPIPVVVNPDGCIDHCHGCQKKCPAGAISYVGDTGDHPIRGCNRRIKFGSLRLVHKQFPPLR